MDRFNYLFDRYINKTATPSERWEFQEILQSEVYDVQLKELLDLYFANFEPAEFDYFNSSAQQTLDAILSERTTLHKVKSSTGIRKLWTRIAAAAAIILITSAGLFYYTHKSDTNQQANLVKQDIKPGGNKAYLTLANGSRIVLTNTKNGQLAKQTGSTITKMANGLLVYSIENTKHSNSATNEYNTIETPKGGQYQVKLPDGTEVWLNAASSLKYPASFAFLKDRQVELTGEAYFEVAKDKAHPFVVKTDKEHVEVLGTHFNINSYLDEPSNTTTLLEGSVKVSLLAPTNNREATTVKTLMPGQQAKLNGSKIQVTEVNAENAIAWKNGEFSFNDEPLQCIMRKIARWYDVEVIYQDIDPNKPFGGTVSRFENISKVLEKLELTGSVKFKITGKKIIVSK